MCEINNKTQYCKYLKSELKKNYKYVTNLDEKSLYTNLINKTIIKYKKYIFN